MKPRRLSSLIVHPFLLALYPVIALITHNLSEVQFEEIWRALLAIPLGVAGLWLLLSWLTKDLGRAGLVVSLVVVLFFSYGHLYQFFTNIPALSDSIGRADVLAAIWAATLIVGPWLVFRLLKRPEPVNRFLNVVSIIAIVLALVPLPGFIVSNLTAGLTEKNTQPVVLEPSSDPPPDIYYIIVDGYGRQDVLQQIYGYDNSAFIEFLQDQGFYITANSHSNYVQTDLSLASSLNLDYLDVLLPKIDASSTTRLPLIELIQESRIRTYLAQAGYQFIALSSSYSHTRIEDADRYLQSTKITNKFEETLLENSIVAIYMSEVWVDTYRRSILDALETLANMPDTGSPRFVFAHILMLHPPFVFGPNGEPQPIISTDDNEYVDISQVFIEGYNRSLIYLNTLLREAITGIKANSVTDPVIILQADHGPGGHGDWSRTEQACYWERMSILNAYYLPGVDENRLYPSISPVNTFRLILDEYYGTDFGLLEDRSYFSRWNTPYQFEDVSDQTNACPIDTLIP